MKKLKKINWESLALAFITIILGVLCVCFPQASTSIFCKTVGWALLVLGVLLLVAYSINMRVLSGAGFVIGVTLLAVGAYFLINSGVVQGILVLLFGAYIVINSAWSVSDCIMCMKEKINGLVPWLVISIISLLLGILIMFISFDKIMILVGIVFIVEGIRHLIFTLFCTKKVNNAKKALKIVVEE